MAYHLRLKQSDCQLDKLPPQCPFCHNSIVPTIVDGIKTKGKLEVYLQCPNEHCLRGFLAYYSESTSLRFTFNGNVSQGTIMSRSFSEVIEAVSSAFVEIYNQAHFAEEYQLLEICGVGYRKGLEFLIKDYAIKNNPDKAEEIRKMKLSTCIERYVSDSNIKHVAKRAAWLGNDEAHYERKWSKDLRDLKRLIDLTLHWIEMESLTKSFIEEMPD